MYYYYYYYNLFFGGVQFIYFYLYLDFLPLGSNTQLSCVNTVHCLPIL